MLQVPFEASIDMGKNDTLTGNIRLDMFSPQTGGRIDDGIDGTLNQPYGAADHRSFTEDAIAPVAPSTPVGASPRGARAVSVYAGFGDGEVESAATAAATAAAAPSSPVGRQNTDWGDEIGETVRQLDAAPAPAPAPATAPAPAAAPASAAAAAPVPAAAPAPAKAQSMRARVLALPQGSGDPGIAYRLGAGEHSPATIVSVAPGGSAHGKVQEGEVVLAINGVVMFGPRCKPDAATAQPMPDGVVRLSVAAFHTPLPVEEESNQGNIVGAAEQIMAGKVASGAITAEEFEQMKRINEMAAADTTIVNGIPFTKVENV